MKSKFATGILLTLLLITSLTLMSNIQQVKAQGTIYIRADGSIDPPTAPITSLDNVTYTLTDNIIYNSIVVERNHIVLDGMGFKVQGTGDQESKAIDLSSRTNVTVKNVEITNGVNILCYCIFLQGSSNNTILENKIVDSTGGIWIDSSSYNNISQNNITNVWYGISLYYGSSNNSISRNDIAYPDEIGIRLWSSSSNSIFWNNITHGSGSALAISLEASSDNQLRNNNMVGNFRNFRVTGTAISDFLNDVDISNTVDSRPIYYWIDRQDTTVTGDPSCVILVNCTRVLVQGLNPSDNANGILLAYTGNSTVTENTLRENTDEIELVNSSSNTISDNDIAEGSTALILESSSDFNNISRNTIHGTGDGIFLIGSSYNNILNNSQMAQGIQQLRLYASSNHNCIYGNTIANGFFGMTVWESSDNFIYHNRFVNNFYLQVQSDNSINTWDDGYPSGGNYWSNYTGVDLYNGPNQDMPGSDGIGDTPYVVNANNQDRYPLVEHDIAAVAVAPSKTVVGQGYSMSINVTVENRGNFTGTFNVTTYYSNATATVTPEQWDTFWSMGDVNRDGYINQTDSDIIIDEWGWNGPPGENPADINSDGSVDNTDLFICYDHLGLNIWTYFGTFVVIGVEEIANLPPGDSATVTFLWDTTGVAKGNHTIKAVADPVLGETDTDDNTYLDGWAKVTIPGDVTEDELIWADMQDIDILVAAFQAQPGSDGKYWHTPPCDYCPHSPNLDINNDIAIDMADIQFAIDNFWVSDP